MIVPARQLELHGVTFAARRRRRTCSTTSAPTRVMMRSAAYLTPPSAPSRPRTGSRSPHTATGPTTRRPRASTSSTSPTPSSGMPASRTTRSRSRTSSGSMSSTARGRRSCALWLRAWSSRPTRSSTASPASCSTTCAPRNRRAAATEDARWVPEPLAGAHQAVSAQNIDLTPPKAPTSMWALSFARTMPQRRGPSLAGGCGHRFLVPESEPATTVDPHRTEGHRNR